MATQAKENVFAKNVVTNSSGSLQAQEIAAIKFSECKIFAAQREFPISRAWFKDPAARSYAARGTVHEETEIQQVRRVLSLADTDGPLRVDLFKTTV